MVESDPACPKSDAPIPFPALHLSEQADLSGLLPTGRDNLGMSGIDFCWVPLSLTELGLVWLRLTELRLVKVWVGWSTKGHHSLARLRLTRLVWCKDVLL